MQQSIFGTNLGIFLRDFLLLLMYTARSPSVFVERLTLLERVLLMIMSRSGQNLRFKTDKTFNALKGQFVRVLSISFHCKIFLGRDYW